MLSELGNDLKNILLAGVGAIAVTAEQSEKVIRQLVKKGEITVEQGKVLTEELKQKVQAARDARAAEQRAKALDLENMSTEERQALKKKLEELDQAFQQDQAEPQDEEDE